MPASTLDRGRIAELVSDLSTTATDTVPVLAPFTGEMLHELPVGTAQDVADAAARARAAQRAWRAAGFAHRRAVLLRAHDILLAERERLMDTLQTETGKTRGQAFEEVFSGASVTRYYAVSARSVLATRRRHSGLPLVTRTRVSYKPKGLVGVITPWNYPLSLSLMDVVPAARAGCRRPTTRVR